MQQQIIELMNLARRLGPEGEELDLEDHDFTIEELVEAKSIIGQYRTAGEVVNRALAQYWNNHFEGVALDYGLDTYYLGYNSKRVFREGQDLVFAEWLKEQTPEDIAKIVSVGAIRVSPLGTKDSPLREQFFDEEKTSDDLRIQTRPVPKSRL